MDCRENKSVWMGGLELRKDCLDDRYVWVRGLSWREDCSCRSVSLRGLAGSQDSVDGKTMQVFRFGWKDYAFECYLD